MWSSSPANAIDPGTGSFDPTLVSGNDTVIYAVGGACPNADTVVIFVKQRADASITTTPDPVVLCITEVPFNFTNAQAGGAWSGTGITDPVNGTFDPAGAGQGIHQVFYTIDGMCGDTDSIHVSISPVPDAGIIDPGPFCADDPPRLIGANSPGGVWSSHPNLTAIDSSTGLFIPALANTGDTLIYVIDDICFNSDTLKVTIIEKIPPVNLGNDTVLCQGQSLMLNAYVPNASYNWQDGSGSSAFNANTAGLYWVKVTRGGCSDSDSISISAPNLKADFGYEEIPCTNQIRFINNSAGANSSYWDFGDGETSNETDPVHNYRNSEQYTVILVINQNSACPDTAKSLVPIENDAFSDTLFIPNVFTPNGDGKNDFFEIKGIDDRCVTINKLTIFNRWGKKVFEAGGTSEQLKWNGENTRREIESGVYFYVFEGPEFKKSGNVTLLR
jgi:gliding motility-associated-like protein